MRFTVRLLYCDSHELEPLYSGVVDRLGFVPGTRDWLSCSDCGSAVLNPLPTSEELPAFYPPVYTFSPELGRDSLMSRLLMLLEYHVFFRIMYRQEARTVKRYAGSMPSKRKLLDVGCGHGMRLVELQKKGFQVEGLDLQPHVCDYLRRNLQVPAICADVNQLTACFAPESLDVITAFFVGEHIPDVRRLLSDAMHVLKPGGMIALGLPLIDCWQAKLFGRRWTSITEAPRHLSLPSRKGIRMALLSVGFSDVQVFADSLLNCSGVFASSLVPGTTLTHLHGKGSPFALVRRLVGGCVVLGSLPFTMCENWIAQRPSNAMICATKPGTVCSLESDLIG